MTEKRDTGAGHSACAGTRLARLEFETILGALLDRGRRIEAEPRTIAMNNTLQGVRAET